MTKMTTTMNLKTISIWIGGALLASASTLALADQAGSTTRQERMDSALADYRAGHGTGSANASSSGAMPDASECNQTSDGSTLSRAGASIQRGACKTGHAIERGVKKTGEAVGRVGHKAGDALRRTGEKIGDKVGEAPKREPSTAP